MDGINRMLLALYQGARELPAPEFDEFALALLKAILRFDSAMWGVGEMSLNSAGPIIQSIHLHKQPNEMLASYEHVKHCDRAAFEVTRNLGKTLNFHFPDINAGSSKAGIRAHSKRFAMQNLLVTTSCDPQLFRQDFLSLWRARSRDQYSQDEHRLAEFLMPHMIEAGRINHLLWLNQMTTEVVARRGARAIGSLDGTLYTSDNAFADILRLEYPDWLPPALPRRLMDALRASSEYRFLGVRITVVASPLRDMLYFRARELLAIDALTSAERTVATRIAHGLAYKEVARELGVSLATVRNQVHNVYQKLGVGNKAALAQRLREGESM
jgi:DNA-binding CsgD family transcriptional regulator